MTRAPSEHDDPPTTWVVDCPRHGRAKIVLDGLDRPHPDVDSCTVFPAGVAPPCDKACLSQFDLGPRGATSTEAYGYLDRERIERLSQPNPEPALGPRATMSPDEFLRTYEAATARHDLEATLALIADDAVYLFSDESSHVGKDAIREALETNFAAIEAEEYRIQGLRWLAGSDDVAACVYEYVWSGQINGEPASGRGRGTAVIRRVHGEWRVAHEHLSRGRLAK
jgi:uncharacterized protein (TIGR02246 family)